MSANESTFKGYDWDPAISVRYFLDQQLHVFAVDFLNGI